MTATHLFASSDAYVVQNHGGRLSIIDARTSASIRTVEIPHSCSLSCHVVSMGSNRLAYLQDRQTIAVENIASGGKSTLSHTEPIDFLEINSEGNFVLFRDEQKKALHLYSIDAQSTATLLDGSCWYAQWVPQSNSIVAQSKGRHTMQAWYDCRQPNHSVMHATRGGTVTGIVRTKDKVNVLIQKGASQSTHPLQTDLIDLWSSSPTSTSSQQNRPDATKAALYQWFLDTRQLEKAAHVKQKEGNVVASAKLYADAGLPLVAAQLVADYNIKKPFDMLEGVVRSLEKGGAYDKASDLLLRIEQPNEAVQVLVRGDKHEQAIALARIHTPERVEALEDELRNKSVARPGADAGEGQFVTTSESNQEPLAATALPPKEPTVEELLASGQYKAAFDILSSKNEWDALWEAASSHDDIDPDLLSQYAAARARQFLEDNDKGQSSIDAALELLTKYCPNHLDDEGLFDDLARRILHRSKQEEGGEGGTLVPRLKSLLFVAASRNGTDTSPQFTEMLHATHYLNMMQLCSEHGLDELGTKCAVTLLRYSGFIPTDKAFYLSGMFCKDKGHTNLAFVLLNRYVDLAEAVEDEAMVDSDDFADPNIIPSITNAPIPATHYVTNEDDREAVRDWVLSTCMDSSVEKELPSSESIHGTIYAGLFQSDDPQCIVTGFPVSRSDQMAMNDGCIANVRDYNKFVSKVKKDPWTGKDL